MQKGANQKYLLHWFQTEELLTSSYMPLIFWYFPRIAIENSGVDAFWAVLGVIICGFIISFLHAVLNDKFPYQSGTDMLRITFGKWIGSTAALFYLTVYLLYCAVCLYFFIDMLRPFHMHTPRSIMIIALCLVSLYGTTRGVESLARVSTGIILLATIGLIITVSITYSEADWYWRPLPAINLPLFSRGVYHLLPLYFGFNLFLMINPYYEHKPNRSLFYAFMSMAKSGFIIISVFIAVVARFGWESAGKITYPVSTMIQLIRLNGWIIERVGVFAVSITVAFAVLFVSNHIWALSALLSQTLRLQEKKFNSVAFPIAGIIVVIALLIPNEQGAEQIVTVILTPLTWIILFIIPLVLLLVRIAHKAH